MNAIARYFSIVSTRIHDVQRLQADTTGLTGNAGVSAIDFSVF
jgi:hypothetical protein